MLQHLVTTTLLFYASTICCVPNIQNQVKKDLALKGEGTFLVTFSAPKVDIANSPDDLYSVAKLKKRLGGLTSETVDEFITSGEYHKFRGEFVLDKIKENHEAFRVSMIDWHSSYHDRVFC